MIVIVNYYRYRGMFFSMLLFVSALYIVPTHAEFLPQAELPPEKIDCCKWNYVAPNEETPRDAIAILRKAPKGIHMAVGTERGFIGAALNPNATHLLLVDIDRNVVGYNKVNIALLKIARSREDYLYLRLNASYKEWVSRVGPMGRVEDLETAPLAHKEIWEWWDNNVRARKFIRFHEAPGMPGTEYAFRDANYLYDNRLFWRLKEMAFDGNMQAARIDLSDLDSVATLSRVIQHSGLKISVLDMSNVWEEQYAGTSRVLNAAKKFRDIADDDALLLVTASAQFVKPTPPYVFDSRFSGLFTGQHIIWNWGYRGFTFGFISKSGTIPEFLPWPIEKNGTIDQ